MPPFKILMIAPTSFFGHYGGHIRILEETRALQALGHQVEIVTYHLGQDIPDLSIHRTSALPYRTDYEVGSSRHKVAFDLLLSLKSLAVSWQFRPDLIHGHMHEGALIGGILAKLWRVPMVFDFQGSLSGEMVDHRFLDAEGSIYPWVWRLEKFISSRLPQAVLTSSLQARELLRSEFQVPATMIFPLPDCANLDHFDPALFSPADKKEARQLLGISAEVPVVAYLGLLADYQGIPHLLQAIAHLKQMGRQMHLLLMGYPNVDRYQQVAAGLDVKERVTFTGRVDYLRDAPRFLAAADIAVSAKMSATEGSGKILNYMAMALPVVAYDTKVHREYLADMGCYVPQGDTQALARALDRLAGQPALRQQLGRKLRRRAEEAYSWPAAAREIEQVYRQLTNHR